MQTRIDLRLPRSLPRTAWSSWTLLAAALAVEVLGRGTTSDLHDGLALSVLGSLILASYLVGGRSSLGWIQPVRAALHRWVVHPLRARRFEIGIDLREQPPVPAGTPPLIRDLMVTLGGTTLVLLVLSTITDVSYRAAAIRVLYLGHLVAISALWLTLLLALATAILVPIACIHDALTARHVRLEPRARRNQKLCMAGYFGAGILGFATLPIWVPVALTAASVGTLLVALWRPSTPPVTLLWRLRCGSEPRSLAWRTYETYCAVAVALIFTCLVLLSLGLAGFGFGQTDPAMPVTTTLGKLVAWAGGLAVSSGAVFATFWIRRQSQRNPEQAFPTSVWIDGSKDGDRAAAHLSSIGWQTRLAPQPPETGDVRIELADSMPPTQGPRTWPLRVSLKGLQAPELIDVLARRDEIQRRRQLMRGLEKIFKHAAKRTFARGTGFWLAPQYWFISGMTRDVDEGQCELGEGTVLSGIIGPSYHLVLSPEARQHLREVLRALEIDLIFVQDGIGFRSLRRVIRILFEHYDIHGGRRRIEDRHLCGLPGIRTFVHDYELNNPLKTRGYPEPDYETLGRARILHVFRDKGEDEQLVEDPVDVEGVPVGV